MGEPVFHSREGRYYRGRYTVPRKQANACESRRLLTRYCISVSMLCNSIYLLTLAPDPLQRLDDFPARLADWEIDFQIHQLLSRLAVERWIIQIGVEMPRQFVARFCESGSPDVDHRLVMFETIIKIP